MKAALDRAKAKTKRLKLELREARAEHAAFRTNAGNILAQHLATERKFELQAIATLFELTDLKERVALQHKMLAEANDDATRYKTLAMNRKAILDDHWVIMERYENDLAEARKRLSYRVWVAVGAWYERRACAITGGWGRFRDRIRNRWLIWRLNAARVDAVTQAGYVPGNLVNAAMRYWEHDRDRLEVDEEVVATYRTPDVDYTHYKRKPGMLRRIKILLGRA